MDEPSADRADRRVRGQRGRQRGESHPAAAGVGVEQQEVAVASAPAVRAIDAARESEIPGSATSVTSGKRRATTSALPSAEALSTTMTRWGSGREGGEAAGERIASVPVDDEDRDASRGERPSHRDRSASGPARRAEGQPQCRRLASRARGRAAFEPHQPARERQADAKPALQFVERLEVAVTDCSERVEASPGLPMHDARASSGREPLQCEAR